jgi:DNA ligase (NAD+)
LQGIARSKQIPFEKVLFALGIRHVGETVAEKLARHFQHIDALMCATLQDIILVPEVGEKVAHSIKEYFQDTDNLKLITVLKDVGLQFNMTVAHTTAERQPLAGKNFVISGNFQHLDRETLKTRIKHYGGKILTVVSRNVDYLVTGHKAGTVKLVAAQELDIQVLSEEQIIGMLES